MNVDRLTAVHWITWINLLSTWALIVLVAWKS